MIRSILALCLVALPLATPAQIVDEEGNVPTLAPLVERVSPAVVNIATSGTVEAESNPLLNDPFFRRFFDVPEEPRQREVQSLGSGVVVDAGEGYVLTNHHVIARADEITVAFNDGRELSAEIVGSDPETDIAVLQVDSDNLTALPLADSDELRVGDYTMAIGNPFGLDHTVTTGIVSGLDRTLPGNNGARLQSFIQTDASINPGNSGGALVNLKGELVGINTAILSRSGGNIGIGFAVPMNMAREVMNQIIEYGEVQRGILGVRVQDLTKEMAEAFDIERNDGALIAQVTPNSPAAEAGLEAGDIVTGVNGTAIPDANAMANAIGLLKIGDEVDITYVRDGEERTTTATVADPQKGQMTADALHPAFAGATFSELDERSPLFGKVEGVLVTDVSEGSRAAEYLQPGDVITSVNRQAVDSMATFRSRVEGSERLLLNIRRDNGAFFVLVR
ncbi:DegQ family serine endoprotease [Spiribacter vilamensis]|uniref:Serine protease Do/serine protease DegQ n=1 Tax=Spiribacter vilamensis TaxID=531306 RepID=A0A4V2GJ15_9GAMM|nr:DegQ family serine endoprotease [Spiribacter vilamensis]RZU98555.1 serine protease Do/serine protease DegQ [Spiribacter vilamensis]TVO60185.1 DegQ family serine endoprotease [Spiribacter vilamensis]